MRYHIGRIRWVLRNALGIESAADIHIARAEIDGAVNFAVGSAQIQNQYAVDKDPNVVIPGEAEGHRRVMRPHVDHAADGLAELQVDSHAKMVVHGIARTGHAAGQLAIRILAIEHLFPFVEREEVADAALCIRPHSRRSIV